MTIRREACCVLCRAVQPNACIERHVQAHLHERRCPSCLDLLPEGSLHLCPPPCRCHSSFAYISPFHEGHCCFQPATQTCHPEEVARWVAERDRRRRTA